MNYIKFNIQRLVVFIVLLIIMLSTLWACSYDEDYTVSDNTSVSEGGIDIVDVVINGSNYSRFTKIEKDNAGVLSFDKSYYCQDYYYLNDTKVVYIGIQLDNNSNYASATQVISPNGNYYRYNTETESVEEVVK